MLPKNQKVCVVGLGYVGLTLAMHSVTKGYEVHGIEILDKTYDVIASGDTYFHEPGLDELLKLTLNKNFFVHKEIPKNQRFDIFIVTVGTPLVIGEKAPNMSVLDNAIESISSFIKEDTLLVLRSTIPVGTSAQIAKDLKEKNNLSRINVSFCPERTAEGKALIELQSLPQIISGNNEEALTKSHEFFENLSDEVLEAESLEEAEIIKLFNNTYRDATFAIANTFNLISQSFNIDGSAVIEKANYNYIRSSISKPGFVSGPCLEKDAYILSSNMEDGDLKNFLLSIRKANENLEERLVDHIKSLFSKSASSKILISGIAFKGVPQTNDLRGSSAVKILDQLSEHASQITIHDFMNTRSELSEVSKIKAIDQEEIFNPSSLTYDYIFILNNNPQYKSSKMQKFIANQISDGAKIIDTWDVMKLDKQFTLSNLFVESSL
jgi:nucleotide sugar dehydrogenase